MSDVNPNGRLPSQAHEPAFPTAPVFAPDDAHCQDEGSPGLSKLELLAGLVMAAHPLDLDNGPLTHEDHIMARRSVELSGLVLHHAAVYQAQLNQAWYAGVAAREGDALRQSGLLPPDYTVKDALVLATAALQFIASEHKLFAFAAWCQHEQDDDVLDLAELDRLMKEARNNPDLERS